MALGFVNENGGDGSTIVPILKYDTRGGYIIKVDRHQDEGGTWVKDESELEYPVKVAMDLENIKVGWLGFVGGAPDFHLVNIGEPMPARPSPDHNQGFQVKLCNKELGLRELSSGAKTMTVPFNDLHNAYEAQKADNAGKVPVIEFTGSERYKVNTPNGELTFKKPVMVISGWVDRPATLDGAAAPQEPAPTVSAPAMEAVATSAAPVAGSDLF